MREIAANEIRLPEDLDLKEEYACFEPTRKVCLAEAVKRVIEVIIFCRENGIRRLLVDGTRSAGGYPSPSVTERFWIAEELAKAAESQVAVSFTLPEYLLDPERFGVTVASNRGMTTNAFNSRDEALAWLLSLS